MTVLSFNLLRDLRDEDGWRWEQRRNLIAQVIDDAKADILLLQEVAQDMRQWLESTLATYAFTATALSQTLGKMIYGGVVAFAASRFRLQDQGQVVFHPYSSTATEQTVAQWPCLYGGHWALLEDLHGGTSRAFLSIHSPHQTQQAQLAVADSIMTWMASLSAGVDTIIGGDFNTRADSEIHRRYTQRLGLHDARLIAGGPDAGKPTIGDTEGGIIDWILYRGALHAVEYRVIDHQAGGIRASDHRAILAGFNND